jgi:hypothetical protein
MHVFFFITTCFCFCKGIKEKYHQFGVLKEPNFLEKTKMLKGQKELRT